MREIREIHVAPLGHEHDRILLPAEEYDADVVYLLSGTAGEDLTGYQADLAATLEREAAVEWREVDLGDVYDVLGEVTTITAAHEGDIVRVNVASGPKLSAVGCAIACMATAATAYYVHPGGTVPPLEERPLTEGMDGVETLPTYPIETPPADHVAILHYVAEADTDAYTPKKSDLIEFSEAAELSYMVEASPANDKAKFALLNTHVVDPLAERGYIEVEPVGRRKQITLTETGENALRAFRHKLDDRDVPTA